MSISKDFPLYHSDLIPIHVNTSERKHTHTASPYRNSFTNEHPEIFRLEGMKERGYFNPYLSESIKVDRSEYLKKLASDRKNINFIDFIKSNRKYSQDPKIIRYITVDFNKELNNNKYKLVFEIMNKKHTSKTKEYFIAEEHYKEFNDELIKKLKIYGNQIIKNKIDKKFISKLIH